MKTAVEQLIAEFNEELQVAIAIGNKDKIRTIKHLINITSRYLEMEKEQIVKAWWESPTMGKYWSAEEYYNETFKQK